MRNERQNSAELMALSSGVLTRTSASTLVRRGIQDLLVTTQADEWCKKGLSLWLEEKYEEAVRCFARGLAADPSNAPLWFYLGLAFYLGAGLPAPDHMQATICWRNAAEQGYVQAQNNLAQCYEEGRGVTCDYDCAVFWYRRAAEQNHPSAQFNLGVLYELGQGVPQDLAQAASWYRRAAERGHPIAQYNLGGMFRLGRGLAEDDAQAAFWYRKSAEQGYAPAQFNLAVLYSLGQGVQRDLERAVFWYREAAERGELSARQALLDVFTTKWPPVSPS